MDAQLLGDKDVETLEKKLDRLSTLGVNLSVIAFVSLQVPQIMQNFTADPREMKNLAWPGFVSGSMGNLLLATYFSGIQEWPAVRVQAIGAITNFFVAAQVYMAGYFPSVQFYTLLVLMGVALLMPLMFVLGVMSSHKFDIWQEATTPIGLAALVFSITATFSDDSIHLLIVSLVGLVIGIMLLALKPRVPILARLSAKLGGWMATFLFMWMPLPQLYKTITVGKKAAAAFSMGFTVLSTMGNGMGSTRAFIIKEKVWFTGSFYGLVVGGWLMAGAVSAVNPVQCPFWVYIVYTISLFGYFSGIVMLNGKAKQESFCQQSRFLVAVQ